MKKCVLFLMIFALASADIYAQNDTLRMYDPNNIISNYYNPTSYPKQFARFDLPMPAIIKGFLIEFDGSPNTTVTMQFVGHEGGTALISLLNNIVPPITITKKNTGQEKIYVPLEEPVRLDNMQFFLVFSDFQGIRLITDRTDHPFSCKSSSGGDYYYQYGMNSSDQFVLLSSQNRAFVIDVILEYPEKQSQNVFRDVTADAGFNTGHSNSTIAAADYNKDGFSDILVAGKLYKNNKNGTFTDVSDQLGIKNKYSSVSGNAFIDMNNDGELDIILLGGDTSVLFLQNAGQFTEYILPLKHFKSLHSFSFADINFDNYPDLFVSQLWTTYPEPEPNYFFYNDGNLGFTDNTTVIYPEYDGTWNWPNRTWNPSQYIVERNRNSRGSQWVDYDNDGDLDLFVTNYFLQPDEFYKNNGNGTFTDISQLKGIDRNNTGHNHGTGVDWYDYNNDGYIDLLLPQFAHPRYIGQYDHRGTTIYKNTGAPDYNFTDMVGQYNNFKGLKADIGLELEETHAGGAWGDVNNDGLADILLTVFYGCRYIDFYEQQPDHTFKMKTFEYGLQRINTGTDLVWLDYDNDGRLDLACGIEGKFRLFKNDAYNDRNWLQLDLVSTSANKYAIGSRAYVYAGDHVYMQEVTAGRGQKMQKPYRLHFGLNYQKKIDSVVVLWPTSPKKRETFTGIQKQNIYTLTEGGNITLSEGKEPKNSFEFDIEVFPNPASDYVDVRFEFTEIPESNIKLVLFNLLLQEVFTSEIAASANKIQIPLHNITEGVYLLKMVSGERQIIRKIIVAK